MMAEQTRDLAVGDVVVYHDPKGNPHNALVQIVWSKTYINVVILSGDENRKDQYGRQIEHVTSVNHKFTTPVHGNYWRFPDEEPNPYVPPQSV